MVVEDDFQQQMRRIEGLVHQIETSPDTKTRACAVGRRMPELDFQVEDAEAAPYAEAPLLNFKLWVINRVAGEAIHSVMLRCQIMIEATRRRYAESEVVGLKDLFGEPDQWSRTLRSTLWTNSSVIVPSFTDSVMVDLPIPCAFDFNVAATKYYAALQSNDAPQRGGGAA